MKEENYLIRLNSILHSFLFFSHLHIVQIVVSVSIYNHLFIDTYVLICILDTQDCTTHSFPVYVKHYYNPLFFYCLLIHSSITPIIHNDDYQTNGLFYPHIQTDYSILVVFDHCPYIEDISCIFFLFLLILFSIYFTCL